MDRRKFFKIFSGSAAGFTLAGKIALAEDISKWMLSPQKTIFIPPPPKINVVTPQDLTVLELSWEEVLQIPKARWVSPEVTEWFYAA